MKASSPLLLSATLGIGIAIGWFARPMPGPISAGAENPSAAAPSPSGDAKPLAEARPAKSDRERPDSKQREESGPPEMVVRMQEAGVERHRGNLEQYVATLTESLKLTPEQTDQLKAAVEAQIEALRGFTSGAGNAADPGGMPALGTDPLEASIAAMLSASQKEDFESFKQREKTRKVDTLALKNLSHLQGIVDFKEGQRDAIYEILSRSAEAAVENPDPATVGGVLNEGMNGEMDAYGLGLQKMVTQLMLGSTAGGDQKSALREFREAFEKRVDAKVEELRPVLDDAQLERYRAELKSKGLGSYAPLLIGRE